MRTVVSEDPEATSVPSRDRTAQYTQSWSPKSVRDWKSSSKLQIRTGLSRDPETSWRESLLSTYLPL
jgi:hypothetical protein